MEYNQKVLDVLHGTGAGATATGQRGNGDDRSISIVLQWRRRRRSIDRNYNYNGTGAGALGHWGKSKSNCNCNGSNGNGATIDRIVSLYVVLQRKTSTIVVVKNVQNVWMTNIPDVLCWIKKEAPFDLKF
jgi:hypothetical protein